MYVHIGTKGSNRCVFTNSRVNLGSGGSLSAPPTPLRDRRGLIRPTLDSGSTGGSYRLSYLASLKEIEVPFRGFKRHEVRERVG